MSHSVGLIQGKGSFLVVEGDIFFKSKYTVSINKRGPYDLPDVQLTRRVSFPKIHKIKQFHLPDLALVIHVILMIRRVLFM